MIFENINFPQYSFFCFGIIEQHYSKIKWNEIRKYMYWILGKNSFYLGNWKLSVNFFWNLLQLCCDIDDAETQGKVLQEFLTVVKKWNVI